MKKVNPKIVLILVIVLAAFLRLYHVPSIPPSLSWDEVSLGYNAYSLLKTGRDEHGKLWPIAAFESYGDYKPTGYIYADIPFVAFFGLTELAVRLPSILAGIFSVYLTYMVVKELFYKVTTSKKEYIALLSAFFLAVSPWHLNISRAGYEANLAHVFVLAAVFFLLKAIHGTGKYFIFSALFFVLALYTFNSARLFVPFLFVGLAIFYYRKLWEARNWLLMSGVIAALLLSPLIPHLLSREGKLRFQEVNIFTDLSPIETANKRIEASGNTWWAKIIHNRRVQFGRELARHYFDNFSMNFLFINGDGNPKFSIRDVGQLYVWDLPFLIMGIYFLIKRKEGEWKIPLILIIAGIIPASVARETPHALRTLNTLPGWQICIAVGFWETLRALWQKNRIKKAAVFSIVFVLFLNSLFYLHTYHTTYAKEFASEWQYGYREAIQKAESIADRYDRIWITDAIGRPYMYTLFYTKFDPAKFQQEVKRTSDPYGFFAVHSFGKYYFDIKDKKPIGKTLFITEPEVVPQSSHIIDIVFLPNGKPVLVLYE